MKKLLRMALFAALPLAAMMMFSSYYGGPENNPCPPPGDDYYTVLVPVPGDCTSFYACSNGVLVLQHCPDGLHFNDELDTCEWPREAGCHDNSGDGSGSNLCCKNGYKSWHNRSNIPTKRRQYFKDCWCQPKDGFDPVNCDC